MFLLTCHSPGPPDPQTTEHSGTGSARLRSCSGETRVSEDHRSSRWSRSPPTEFTQHSFINSLIGQFIYYAFNEYINKSWWITEIIILRYNILHLCKYLNPLYLNVIAELKCSVQNVTYCEVDLAAAHHKVQEGVLSYQLHTHTHKHKHTHRGHSVNESITCACMCILYYTQSLKLHTHTYVRRK